MKLRLNGNSIRLRLSRTEVNTFADTGLLEDRVEFPPNPLVYVLHSAKKCRNLQVSFADGWITVSVPEPTGLAWATGPGTGIEGVWRGVTILIEKDFACLHGDPTQNDDTFERPT